MRTLLAGRPAVAGAALAVAALVLGACESADGETARGAGAPAGGAVYARADFLREIQLTGELEATRSIAIKSPETSLWQLRITYMAEEGAFVEKGQPLLDFDNSSLAAQVRELETQILDARTQIVAKKSELASALKDLEIELAERDYEEARTGVEASVDPEVMSAKEFAEREFAWDKAKTELEETHKRVTLTRERGQAELDVLEINLAKLERDMRKAQDHLDLLSIQAPAAGLVVYEKRPQTTLRFQEGDSCWPGQNVMQLPDLNEMQVVFSVSEVDAPLLAKGMELEVTLDAFPGRRLGGRIIHIPSMAVKRDEDSRLRIFKVVASLDETWVGDMKPGMSVRGRLVLERRENAPLVARRAVRFDGKDYWLATGTEGGALREVRIEPIARNAAWYLVSEDAFAQLSNGVAPEPARASMGG